MIILDLSQVAIASLTQYLEFEKEAKVEDGLIRHMLLKTLRRVRNQFPSHKELVIACDARRSWRYEAFPLYKARRRMNKDKSPLDWKFIFDTISMIKLELSENFPYRIVEVDRAEADDVIGVLCYRFGEKIRMPDDKDNILILSGDKDFKQLQFFGNVTQYDPVRRKELACSMPEAFLREHIIRGDEGDGITNIFSDEDTFISPDKRQKKVMTAKLEKWVTQRPEIAFADNPAALARFRKNEQLIDLRYTPDEVKKAINECFDLQAGKPKDRSKLFGYFLKHQLKELTTNIQDF